MADFTYLLMQWVMAGLEGADLERLNIPTIEEARGGRDLLQGFGKIVNSRHQLVLFL
jgi:hypothetical protein